MHKQIISTIVLALFLSGVYTIGRSQNNNGFKAINTKAVSNKEIRNNNFREDIRSLKISRNTRLVGMCDDHENFYDIYSFEVKDSAQICHILTSLKTGEKLRNYYFPNEFDINVVNNNCITDHIAINPKYGYLRYKGQTYKFDFAQIPKLTKKNKIIWDARELTCTNKKAMSDSIIQLKKDTNLLYYFSPDFISEGNFKVTIPKSEHCKNPTEATNYLDTIFTQWVSKADYRILYELSINDVETEIKRDSITLNVSATEKLYNNFRPVHCVKSRWEPCGSATINYYLKRK